MLRHPLFWLQFWALALVAALHFLGISLEWYWRASWYDILVHGLGGVWVGLATVWFFYYAHILAVIPPRRSMVLFAVGAALMVGVVWELFELWLPVPPDPDYYIDTFVDLVMDGVGGAISSGIVMYIYGKK